MNGDRRGMALAVVIGVVSLIAILAVATLSLGGRAVQGSTIGVRDARLDAAVEFGLAEAIDGWRERGCASLAVGASTTFSVSVPGVPVVVGVRTTRIGPDLFWVVAEAGSTGESMRRENLIVRARIPDVRGALADDQANVANIGFLSVDSIAARADTTYESGAVLSSLRGVIHVKGDATVLGGSGDGILIVEGRLSIAGPFAFSGVIVARRGISAAGAGVNVVGMIRAAGQPALAGVVGFAPSQPVLQAVLLQAVTPVPVFGRRWAELF